MKSKQEIENKLKMYKQTKDNSELFSEFIMSVGAIIALKWVLGMDYNKEYTEDIE